MRGYTVQTEDVFELVHAQRRASLRFLGALIVPVLFLLLSFVLLPSLTDWAIRGVPAPWILLGPVTLFAIVGVAWRHDRSARRVEDAWASQQREGEE